MLRLPERGPIRLRVRSGRVWITQAGCVEDWFVDAPQALTLSGQRIVIEAETACEVELAPLRAAPSWWRWRRPLLIRN